MAGEKKGLKLRRQSKGKVYYAAQFQRTEVNRKKRMRRHLRAHPMDANATKLYEAKYGKATGGLGETARGARRAWRWIKRQEGRRPQVSA